MILSTGDVPPDYDVINIVYSSGQDTISAAFAELASYVKDRGAYGIFAVRVVAEIRLVISTGIISGRVVVRQRRSGSFQVRVDRIRDDGKESRCQP